MRTKTRRLFGISGISLTLLICLSGLGVASGQGPVRTAENIDTRWLAWIGQWRLVSDSAEDRRGGAKEDYYLEIVPGGERESVIMKSHREGKEFLETKIVADGVRRPIKDDSCTGWYTYSWSDTGKRLLFESESGCSGELPRSISGISMIAKDREWVDIQLLKSDEDQAVSVRRYRMTADRIGSGGEASPGEIGYPRFQAGTNLSIDEIIELNRKLPAGLLEAVLVELHQPFKLNSKTLNRLADAGVGPQIVDLMVALSFPDKFTVERRGIAPLREADAEWGGTAGGPDYMWLPFGYWSVYGPYSTWYWGSPIYSFYGYGGPGWYIWPGGYYYGPHGDWGDYSGGRLVNGRGYSKVSPSRGNAQPRYAQPRNGSGNISGFSNSSTSNRSTSRSSSSRSSVGSRSSGSSAPNASPGGYHGSGSGDRGKARPRD
jgi:hypothetical protein